MKPRAPIIPRIDPMTLPYRPKLIIPKEKIEELFSMINLMDSQQLKQYSIVNNITLNVEDPISGDSLIHKVITSPNLLKKEFHRLNIVKFLVQNNVHPDKPNKENQTPLHLACKAQYSTIVNYLISLDVDLNFQDNYGFSSLHYALQGKIELYEEPREVKDFIQKPKKVDFTKREDLIEIKKELWDIIKDDPFLGLLKNTLDLSLFNDPKIAELTLTYKKKLVDLAIDEKVIDRNKIIKEEFELIKKGITELITKKWGGFKNLSELEIHKVEANSWISTENGEFSPLKIKDVKETIKGKIQDTKNQIKILCRDTIKDEDIKYESEDEYNKLVKAFYKKFVDENPDSFQIIRSRYILNKEIEETTWNKLNEELISSRAIDFADNIIDWDELSFYGGSRKININYIVQVELDTIVTHNTIEEIIFHILLDNLVNNNETVNIPFINGNFNILNSTIDHSWGGVIRNVFDYNIGNDDNWIQLDKIILCYNYIFSNKEPIKFPDANVGGLQPWNQNPIRKAFIDKWTNLFLKKKKASVLYTMYTAFACLLNNDNLSGTIKNTICGLASALALTEESTIITKEILLNGMKKFFISNNFNKVLIPLPAQQPAILPLNPISVEEAIINTIKILLSKDTINLVVVNNDLTNKVRELFFIHPNNQIEKQNKIDDLIKSLITEINKMKYKPQKTDVLSLITFLNNGFQDDDVEYFRLDRAFSNNPLLLRGPKYVPEPNFINAENYSTENKINQIVHIIKKRQVSELIPFVNHILETINDNTPSTEFFSNLKLQEAKCLGLYYLGLIPAIKNSNGPLIPTIIENYNESDDLVLSSISANNPFYGFQFVGIISTGKLLPNRIPIIGNYIDIAARPPGPGVPASVPGVAGGILQTLEKANYYLWNNNNCRPPLREFRNNNPTILQARNKRYLMKVLKDVLDNNENSLFNLLDDNRKLSKSFREIYPIITVINDLIESYNDTTIKSKVENIINNLNKLNGYIFLYYYIYHQDNLMKLPKFNFYEIPPLDKKGKFLYFEDPRYNLYDSTTNELSELRKLRGARPNDLTFTDNINESVIYNQGLKRFSELMTQISNNFMKGTYFIEKKSLILAKDSKLPPSLASMLSELYQYNLMKIILLVFNYIKGDFNPAQSVKINDLFKTTDSVDDVQKYLVIGKLTQELVNDLAKKYIDFQTKVFMEKIIKVDNSYLTKFTEVIKQIFNGIYNNPKDYEINLKETSVDLQFVNTKILDKNRICASPGKDDINEFIIFPEEYANSELLKSKYVLKIHNQIYIRLLENSARFLLDSNNQSPIFPILKFHHDSILPNLLEFTDSDSYNFLKDEFNNHLFKLTNGSKDDFKEWICNFVLYQKEEVINLILNNDKYGNNFPNNLDESFERVCYIMNEYINNNDLNLSNVDFNKKLDNIELNTYILNTEEIKVINENENENKDVIDYILTFYKKSNANSEIYFKSGKYTKNNKVLSFVKDLLIEMTRDYIIASYIILIKKILRASSTNNLVNQSLINQIEDVLKNDIVVKIVENSINIFEDSNKESEFNLVSVKELLDGVLGLLTVDSNVLINEDSTDYKNIKEANSYFDTFVNKTVLNWNIICENVLKFNINQGRIIRCLNYLVNFK
jgi:hypothetical protein